MDQVARLSDERMRDVASVPGNVVYEYQYDSAEKEADASQVVKLAKAIIDERSKWPRLSDGEAEDKIKASSEAFDVFSRTHARIFSMMCDRENCGRSFSVLCRLAVFRRDSESAGMSEAEASAKVSEFLMGECGRAPTGEERSRHEKEDLAASSVATD